MVFCNLAVATLLYISSSQYCYRIPTSLILPSLLAIIVGDGEQAACCRDITVVQPALSSPFPSSLLLLGATIAS